MAKAKLTVRDQKKMSEETLQSLRDSIVIDPTKNSPTSLGMVGAGQKAIGRIDGQWCPGPGWPYFGPGGDPNETFPNGAHKFCCLIVVFNAQNVVVGVMEDDAKDGFEVDNASGGPVFYGAMINDDKYDDNYNNPNDPMRATLGV